MDFTSYSAKISTLGFSKEESEEFKKKRKQQFNEILKRLEKCRDQDMRFWQAISTLTNSKQILVDNKDPYSWEGLRGQGFDMLPEPKGYGIFLDSRPVAWVDSYESAIEFIKRQPLAKNIELNLMTSKQWKDKQRV